MRDVQPRLDARVPRRRSVSIYVDESKPGRWLYIGMLLVPDDERGRLLDALVEDRYHYTGELHFTKISNETKVEVARRWLGRAKYCDNGPRVRWRVLGIDMQTLDGARFGPRAQRNESIYRVCLRWNIKWAMKAFFPEGTVVSSIVHDARNLAADEYFHWHTPWRLRTYDGLRIATDEIRFLDSDHRKSGSDESHLIQFVDLITGATRTCLDESASLEDHRVRLATEWLPLIEVLTGPRWQRWRTGGEFDHRDRCDVSFWPHPSAADGERAFYSERPPVLMHRTNGQPSLFT